MQKKGFEVMKTSGPRSGCRVGRWVMVSVVAACLLQADTFGSEKASQADFRVWTSTSGARVEARLIFNYGTSVRLVKRDGAKIWIRTVNLSKADRAFLKSRGPKLKTLTPRRSTRGAAEPDKLDLNSASVDELKFLPKIGDSLARRIIDSRPFEKVSDLLEVTGIGVNTYKAIEDQLTVGPWKPPRKKRRR